METATTKTARCEKIFQQERTNMYIAMLLYHLPNLNFFEWEPSVQYTGSTRLLRSEDDRTPIFDLITEVVDGSSIRALSKLKTIIFRMKGNYWVPKHRRWAGAIPVQFFIKCLSLPSFDRITSHFLDFHNEKIHYDDEEDFDIDMREPLRASDSESDLYENPDSLIYKIWSNLEAQT